MRGFTLLEVLLAILIFSIVVTVTYGAYNMTFRVMNNATVNSDYAERARIALDRISDDLLSLYGGNSPRFLGESESFGEYRGDRLTFVSTAHLSFYKDEKPVGSTTIAYRVTEEDGQLSLYRIDTPYLPEVEEEMEIEDGLLLCDGLREVIFSYGGEDGELVEEWSYQQSKFPQIVAVRLGFMNEENTEETVYYGTKIALAKMQ